MNIINYTIALSFILLLYAKVFEIGLGTQITWLQVFYPVIIYLGGFIILIFIGLIANLFKKK